MSYKKTSRLAQGWKADKQIWRGERQKLAFVTAVDNHLSTPSPPHFQNGSTRFSPPLHLQDCPLRCTCQRATSWALACQPTGPGLRIRPSFDGDPGSQHTQIFLQGGATGVYSTYRLWTCQARCPLGVSRWQGVRSTARRRLIPRELNFCQNYTMIATTTITEWS